MQACWKLLGCKALGGGVFFFLCGDPTVYISTVDSAETGPSEGVPMGEKTMTGVKFQCIQTVIGGCLIMSAPCANSELRPKANWNNRYHAGFWGHTHHITYIAWQSMTRFGVILLPFDDLSISSWCVSVCGVFNVSGYRCVCVAWAGRVLYSWGILRVMRGPRASFSLL